MARCGLLGKALAMSNKYAQFSVPCVSKKGVHRLHEHLAPDPFSDGTAPTGQDSIETRLPRFGSDP